MSLHVKNPEKWNVRTDLEEEMGNWAALCFGKRRDSGSDHIGACCRQELTYSLMLQFLQNDCNANSGRVLRSCWPRERTSWPDLVPKDAYPYAHLPFGRSWSMTSIVGDRFFATVQRARRFHSIYCLLKNNDHSFKHASYFTIDFYRRTGDFDAFPWRHCYPFLHFMSSGQTFQILLLFYSFNDDILYFLCLGLF